MPFLDNFNKVKARFGKHASENTSPEPGVNTDDKDDAAQAPVQAGPSESTVPTEKPTTLSAPAPVPAPEDEDEPILPKLVLPDPFYGLQNSIAWFGFSQQGQSHITSQAPCQDRCCSAFLPELGYLILAVADGVGSCALSDLGAQTAVTSLVDYLKRELLAANAVKLDAPAAPGKSGTIAGTLLRGAMQHAYDQVIKAAEDHQQLLYSLQSTLTAVIYDGTDLYYAHAGDDGIVALTADGNLSMVTTRHKGEEASSVYPLQERSTWQFVKVPNTVAFVMATDGVLDAIVRNAFENNRVYYPFIEPIFTAKYKTVQDAEQICRDFYTYMAGDDYRAKVTDDLTITAAVNVKKVSSCLPKFDMNAWNEESRKYEQMRRAALYSNKPEQTQPAPAQAPAADPAEPQNTAAYTAAPQNPVPDPVQGQQGQPAVNQGQLPHQSPGWKKFRKGISSIHKKASAFFHNLGSVFSCFDPNRGRYEPCGNTNNGRNTAPDQSSATGHSRKNSGKKHPNGCTIFGVSIVASLTLLGLALLFLLYKVAEMLITLLWTAL